MIAPRLPGGNRLAAAVAGLLLSVPLPAVAAWERVHGDGANTGFADVVTAPAGAGSLTVPGLGTFAPGAGPVIAADGTVILGTEQGRLVGLHADGSPYWSRDLPAGRAILASPAIGANGMVYVVGVTAAKDGHGNRREPTLELYRFTTSGGMPGGGVPFPEHGGVGITTAPPNIWKNGGTEAVMVPAVYKNALTGGYELRLIAFAAPGGIIGDVRVTTVVPEVTGGNGAPFWYNLFCMLPPYAACLPYGFTASNPLPENAAPPLPGVAIYTYPGGGTPWVIVSDQIHDVVGYTFQPDGRFFENFRLHDTARAIRSAPAMLGDSHSITATDSGAVFAGPSGVKLPAVTGLPAGEATPTRMADGRVVLVGVDGRVTLLQGSQAVWSADLPGRTLVGAAASRTHVFVSTTEAFVSYDSASMAEVSRIDWVGGGVSPPAIGPDGRVYAIASDILFVFPPPRPIAQPLRTVTAGAATAQLLAVDKAVAGSKVAGASKLLHGSTALGGSKVAPSVAILQPQGQTVAPQPQPQPASQSFTPPLPAGGKRLYACRDFSGKACGAPVAAGFCQQQGFARAGSIAMKLRTVQAETLDGKACTAKACRVFDRIVCTR
jgi:hypothetical protein